MVNSCLGCTERTVEPNCHTTCEKYLSQLEKHREIMKRMNEDLNSDVELYGYSSSNMKNEL